MEPALKSRLIGAAVLVAIAVIVVPMFFSGTPPNAGNQKSMSLQIPSAPSSQMRSETLPVGPQAAGSSASNAVSSDHLATVNIPSRQPASVEPGQPAASSGSVDSSDQSPASASHQAQSQQQAAPPPSREAPAATQKPTPAPAAPAPKAASHAASSAPGTAARSRYTLNLGAYGKRANAQRLMQRVAKLGYPVKVDATRISGNPAARVIAGPFDSRASAEAARLKIKGAVHGVPAKLTSAAEDQQTNAPASALPAHRAGAWAVQLGAFSHKSDAAKLRDRVRAAGFDGYLDDVVSGGKTLWRVRVGPQTARSDALKTQAALKSKLKLGGVVVTTS